METEGAVGPYLTISTNKSTAASPATCVPHQAPPSADTPRAPPQPSTPSVARTPQPSAPSAARVQTTESQALLNRARTHHRSTRPPPSRAHEARATTSAFSGSVQMWRARRRGCGGDWEESEEGKRGLGETAALSAPPMRYRVMGERRMVPTTNHLVAIARLLLASDGCPRECSRRQMSSRALFSI